MDEVQGLAELADKQSDPLVAVLIYLLAGCISIGLLVGGLLWKISFAVRKEHNKEKEVLLEQINDLKSELNKKNDQITELAGSVITTSINTANALTIHRDDTTALRKDVDQLTEKILTCSERMITVINKLE